MRDSSGKLMAWLDGELPAEEAADVQHHLQTCADCRGRVEAYLQISGAFNSYCDAYGHAVMASKPRRKRSHRLLTVSGVGAAAALAGLFLFSPRPRVPQSPLTVPAKVVSPTTFSQPVQAAEMSQATQTEPVVVNAVPVQAQSKPEETRRSAARLQVHQTGWLPVEPALEIAIPADAIFPPGALPEGVGFTANVTIAPDGSAQQISVRPQLTEFERRSTQP